MDAIKGTTKYLGLLKADRGPTTHKPSETVSDGYSSICPRCTCRHGRPLMGVRSVSMEECQGCKSKQEVIHPKNFTKVNDAKFLKKSVMEAERPRVGPNANLDITRKDSKGRRVYRNVEHLL